MPKKNELKIINSTEEFLIFSLQNQTEGIQVFVKDENLWMSQKLMA